jgi:hypothetical protein
VQFALRSTVSFDLMQYVCEELTINLVVERKDGGRALVNDLVVLLVRLGGSRT